MARNYRPRNVENTGFGVNSAEEGGRLVNKDGSTNLRKTGVPFYERISIYHTLLRLPRWEFLGAVVVFYTSLNLFFAMMYLLNGVEHLHGVEVDGDTFGAFLQAYFFSSQTLTTVGYGHISPSGTTANIIASLESFTGILSFALVTGMLYARFTRPQAYLWFSKCFLIAPYKNGRGLMFRIASYKNNHLTDVEAQAVLALRQSEHGKAATRFYPLELEISKITSLALNWTINHPITEASPLYGLDENQIREMRPEMVITIKGFDDHFSNIVQQRTSYDVTEMVYGARFTPMYHRSDDGSHTILELDRMSDYEEVKMPATSNTPEGEVAVGADS
jgi:inward rectifier potassium channel